jgi:hypothetical protein
MMQTFCRGIIPILLIDQIMGLHEAIAAAAWGLIPAL